MYIPKRIKKFIKGLRIRPAQIIVIGFGLLILMGGVLLSLPIASQNGRSIGFLNALFTSTSATCVTGLIVVDTYTHWTAFGKCVILFLIQIGGLGFMTLTTLFSFFLRRTITMRERILIAESINYEEMQGIVRLAQHILIGTVIIEGTGAVILSLRLIPEFGVAGGITKGIFHSVSSFCNAGFDLFGERQAFSSLTHYSGDWIINLTIMSLIILGGLGFVVWEDVVTNRKWSKFRLHTKMVLTTTGLLIFVGALLIFIFEIDNPKTIANGTISQKILGPLFQSVTSRTAGYNTLSLADMTLASLFVMVILMFIGGSPGSTAGGVKTTTVGVIIAAVLSVVRAKEDVNLYGRRIARHVVLKALVIILMGFIVVGVGIMALLAVEDFSFMDVVFEVVSAFGTVGLTTGITPHLTSFSKLVLIFIMYAGRVGVMSIALAIAFRNPNGNVLKYPEGKIMVG